MSTPALRICEVDAQGSEATQLLHQAALEARRLYGDLLEADAPLPVNDAWPARGVYLVAFRGDRPVGCAALRPIGDRTAEVRRVFVTLTARRRGVARRLMEAVEAAATRLGHARVRLETGNRQLAAIALFEALGYGRIAPFGPYRDDPTSVCFEKRIAAGRVAAP